MLTALLLLAAVADTTHARRAAPADPTPPAAIHAARLTAPVHVDGVLDEPVWQGPGVDKFTQREPQQDSAPTERTVVWVAFDNEALYVAARMYDSHPDSVRAVLARRDRWAESDRFNVYVDSYNDNRSGFFFGLNAAGTQYDGTMFNDDWDDDSWDGVWTGAVRRDSLGWTAEFRIPYSELRFHPAASQTWGINFNRFIDRKNERDYLVYTPRNGSGYVSRFPDLIGLDGLNPPRRLAVVPYATTRAHLAPSVAGDPFFDGSDASASIGADAKFGIGSNLTVDATVNPDFGQVEVDPAFVNLSDAEFVFQEKRPFFIEGSNTFNFGQGGANNYWSFNWGNPDFFYSRRVGRAPRGSAAGDFVDIPEGARILGAAKVTGKIGGTANLGVFTALTRREYASTSTGGVLGRAEVEPLASYTVARAQNEFHGGRQGLGIIATFAGHSFSDQSLRDVTNGSSLGLGLDGWVTLDHDRKWVMTGWAGLTDVHGSATRIAALQQGSVHYFQRPDASEVSFDPTRTSLSGWASRVTLNKQKGDWKFNSAVGAIAPGFDQNDLGLNSRTDVVNGHVALGYSWSKPTSWYQELRTDVATFRNYDFGGDLVSNGYFEMGYVTFKSFQNLNWSVSYNPSTLNDRLTRGGPMARNPSEWSGNLSYGTDTRKRLSGQLSLYNDVAGATEHSYDIGAYLEYRPSTSLTISAGPDYNVNRTALQSLGSYADPTASATYGARYLFGSLDQTTISANIRVNWIFTPRLSLEMFAQPFLSSGNFGAVHALAAPRKEQYLTFGQDGASTRTQAGSDITIDADGAGPAPSYTYSAPDFTFASLRGNAVVRWEYAPGATIFFVWT
ncbi:MAG TPA: DUF5916 domain-containing protein, partial [Gemmatimonadales bacterium]|nr:DUF5916 domain-containing protein [Gemmatimonadales bacterium]